MKSATENRPNIHNLNRDTAAIKRAVLREAQTYNGKQKSISVTEAILRKAGMDALNGNAKAQKIMLDYFEKNERRQEELAQRVEALREDDRTLLAETIKEYMEGNVNDTTK